MCMVQKLILGVGMQHRVPYLHISFRGFTSTSVSPSCLDQHCHYLVPLRDHVHLLMWVHSTQFGNQFVGPCLSSAFQFIDQVFGIYCKGCQGVCVRENSEFCETYKHW